MRLRLSLPLLSPQARSRLALPLLTLPLLAACVTPIPDDRFEPNNRPDQATPLQAGVPLEARALEADPDVFAMAVEAGARLRFRLRHLEHDCCVGFQLHAPGGALLLETRARCPLVTRPVQLAEGVHFEAASLRNDFEIRVDSTLAGTYYLTLLEGASADGLGQFLWSYELVAQLED